MPKVVQAIDEIAREKNRDVLFIQFEGFAEKQQQDTVRNHVLAWLDQQGIAYESCVSIAEDEVIGAYAGDIYVDVAYDTENPIYQKLSQYLEDDQGNMKIEGVLFFVLSLETALEIAADREEFYEDENDDTDLNTDIKLS